MLVPSRNGAGILLFAMLAGCNPAPAPPVGTGAREAVATFYDGLLRQDWQQAYALLHPDSQKRLTVDLFHRRGKKFQQNLGFEPTEVKVLSCEEKGADALARVVLIGHNSSRQKRYKEGVVLRQSEGSWRVILADNFGRKPH